MIQTSALAGFLAHRPASPCTAGHRVYSQIWITAAVVHFSGSIPHQKQMLEAKFSVQDCTTIWGACRDNGVRSHTCARECRRARHLPKCSLEMLTGAFLSLPVNPSTLVVSWESWETLPHPRPVTWYHHTYDVRTRGERWPIPGRQGWRQPVQMSVQEVKTGSFDADLLNFQQQRCVCSNLFIQQTCWTDHQSKIYLNKASFTFSTFFEHMTYCYYHYWCQTPSLPVWRISNQKTHQCCSLSYRMEASSEASKAC